MLTSFGPRWLALPALALLSGCAVASMASLQPPESANPFEGAAGTELKLPTAIIRRDNTPPSFGPYQVSDLHRGWTSSRTYQDLGLPEATGSVLLDLLRRAYTQRVTTTKGRSRFHFADDQHQAEVYTTTETLVQRRVLSPTLSEALGGSEKFTAIIVGPKVGAVTTWFLRLAPPGTAPDAAGDAGLVGDETQVLLRLRHLPHPPLTLPSGRRVPWPNLYRPGNALPWAATGQAGGFEVLYQAQRVGYIDYATAHPSVWLRDDLSPDLRFLVATVLSTVLLKSSW